ncbi:MAG: nitroreductase family protein [Helicobacteraceae bacterium]|jgi:nitroreductase|nr:nitroreductase family protein [Helicobacteraceae bacterium]
MKEIFSRYSVRKFQDKQVEPEKVKKLLEAAMQAPSAGNQQPWEFLVITNNESKEAIARICQYSKPILGAPLGIMVLQNSQNLRYPECAQQDLGAACENILLEATHLGLGGVWMAIMDFKPLMQGIKEYFKLPAHIEGFATIALGYPAESKTPRLRYDESRAHYENYGS